MQSKSPDWRRIVWAVVVTAILLFWWFYVTDWISRPRSYRAGVFYVCCVLLSSGWHLRALVRFNRMVKVVRREELAGTSPEGSTLFAANQRFRYAMRSIEAIVVLTIGTVAILSVKNPSLQLNKNYIRLVLTYFIGSVLLTGYLTVRDLVVIDRVKKLNHTEEDDAILASPKEKKDA